MQGLRLAHPSSPQHGEDPGDPGEEADELVTLPDPGTAYTLSSGRLATSTSSSQ